MKFVELKKPNTLVGQRHFIKEKGKFIPFDGITGMKLRNYSIKIYRKK